MLSKEEIEKAKDRIKILLKDECNCTECIKNKSAYKLLLQYTKELEADNYELNNRLNEYIEEREKQNKIIELMCEQLAGLAIWNNEKEEPLILMDKEEVKQYFEKKVREFKWIYK